MRYTTSAFGEVVTVLGRFKTGRTPAQMLITIWDLTNLADVTPVSPANQCAELGTTGVYYWKSSSLTTQPTTQTEFMYIMLDDVTKRTYDGKFVLGGHTDDAAISRHFNAVYIDVDNGTAGTGPYMGTPTMPVNNIADAFVIASKPNINLRKYVVSGEITLDRNYINWEIEGAKSTATSKVNLAGYDVSQSNLSTITVAGAMGGTIPKQVTFNQCILENVTGYDGVATDSGIRGTLALDAGPGTEGLLNNCRMISEYPTGQLNINGANTCKWANAAGYLAITGMVAGSSLTIGCTSLVVVWVGNTGGDITIGGLAVYALDFDTPGVKNFVFDETYNRAVWGDLPWDEPIGGHVAANTFGRILGRAVVAADTAATAGSSPTEIRTGLTQADDFFNNMQVLVINSAGVAVRNIDDFQNTNGAIIVEALPFTPAVNDPVIILGRTGSVPLDIAAIWAADTHIAETATVIAGSTLTEVRTDLTQADDYWTNMQMIVENTGGTGERAARNIDQYLNANGALSTFEGLPWVPQVGDNVYIVARTGSLRDNRRMTHM
jgi:hypothetical protein